MKGGHLGRSHFTYCCESEAVLGGGGLEEDRTAPSRGWLGTLERIMEGLNGGRTIALDND